MRDHSCNYAGPSSITRGTRTPCAKVGKAQMTPAKVPIAAREAMAARQVRLIAVWVSSLDIADESKPFIRTRYC